LLGAKRNIKIWLSFSNLFDFWDFKIPIRRHHHSRFSISKIARWRRLRDETVTIQKEGRDCYLAGSWREMNDRTEHPMTAVPDAIRIVLSEAARLCLPTTNNLRLVDTVLLKDVASVTDLMGRTLAADVTMRDPGYPPYQASIMDGFAIRTSEFECHNINLSDSETGAWTHTVIDKIFAGDESQPKSINADNSELASAYYDQRFGAMVPGDFTCVVPLKSVEWLLILPKLHISSTSSKSKSGFGKWDAIFPPGRWYRGHVLDGRDWSLVPVGTRTGGAVSSLDSRSFEYRNRTRLW
jgi:hypothetical protein